MAQWKEYTSFYPIFRTARPFFTWVSQVAEHVTGNRELEIGRTRVYFVSTRIFPELPLYIYITYTS